jgi:ferric-dicitrate binding protein FerR (iron transport regulator)
MNELEIRIVDLVEKHLNGELSDAEKQELESWKNQSESNRRIVRYLTDNSHLKHSISDSYPDERKDRVLASIHSMIEADQGEGAKVKMMTIRKLMSAAAIIGLIACIAYFTLYERKPQPVAETKVPSATSDQAPGRDGAILKLSNGQEIVLDNAANGALAQQGSAKIAKRDGNVLVYSNNGKAGREVLYNTLSTQIRKQFQVVLPDGSQVWLNSESSITYPTTFTGNERNVKVTGEVYMEVAKDAKRPFKVHIIPPVSGMEETVVQVLGTHFNINAYADDSQIKATLLEGSIRLTTGNKATTLKPGQQARVRTNNISVQSDVDLDKEVAWKNGYFQFKDDQLQTVVQQLARWYGVTVIYSPGFKVPDDTFNGRIPRSSDLTDVLNVLEKNQVHFKVEGKKIIVSS